MRKKPNTKMIGLFLVIGIALFAIVVLDFVKDKFGGGKNDQVVMFFEESITGLNVGSPVVFKGVQVGQVSKIGLFTDPDTLDFNIPVYAKMNQQSISSFKEYKNKKSLLEELIKKGLRARLATQSFVTGQLMIELEMMPGTPVVMRQPPEDTKFKEIPTMLSPLEEISKGLQDLPIRESVIKFNQFFTSLNEEIPQISKTIKSMGRAVDGNARVASETLDNLNKAAVNVSAAAKALRNFADYIERHPEALLKGKK